MVHSLGGEVETGSDVGVAQPLGNERQDFKLARGQVGVVASRMLARATRQVTRSERAQAARDDAGGGLGTEALQRRQGFSQRTLVIGPSARQGCFVRTATLLPEVRGSFPMATDLQRVRLGGAVEGRIRFHTGTPAPAGQLANLPRCPALNGQCERRLGSCGDVL